MAVEIKSGAGSDLVTIEPVSKSIRVTPYSSSGVEIVDPAPVEISVLPATAANNDIIAAFDVSAYKFVSLQLSGTWAGTVQFQGSNDNGTFYNITVQNPSAILSPYVTSITANGLVKIPIVFRYLRVRITAYTSGTVSGACYAHKEDNVTGQISSTGSVSLNAETTKTIGTVRAADGAGNLLQTAQAGTDTNNLTVIPAGQIFAFSTLNSTSTQLAAGASFVGTIESIISQQSYSILAYSDKSGIITIDQFSDALGLRLNQTLTFTLLSGQGFTRSGVLNGNYVRVTFQNTGSSTTGLLSVDTAFGTIPSATQLNNSTVALNEINGYVVATNVGAASSGTIRVVTATDSTIGTVTNLSQMSGIAIAMGSGAVTPGTQRVTLATDDTVAIDGVVVLGTGTNSIGDISNLSKMGGVAVQMGSGIATTGTQRVTLAVDDQVKLAAGTNIIGTVRVLSGNTSTPIYHKLISAVGLNPTLVKSSPANMAILHIVNGAATPRYFKLYNKSTAPVVGTDVPMITITLPPGASNFTLPALVGIDFSVGLAYAVTLGVADTDTTPFTVAGEVTAMISYT